MKYGMPYKGSKNQIAETLIARMPPATHFYDLFGGGGAMTHCALLSGKFQYVHYNELDPLVFRGFQMFINGDFKTENRWISREDFYRLRDSDPYVAICFSFGNDLKSYAYSTEREKLAKAIHYSICFNDNSLLLEYTDLKGFEYHSEDIQERRLELQRYLKQRIENLERLGILNTFLNDIRINAISRNLLNLKNLNSFKNRNIFLTNQSYDEVQIEEDAVIYCDPPYQNTNKYKVQFNHQEFYEWLRHSESQVFISEYEMPDDFFEVYSVKKLCSINDKGSFTVQERLYSNKPIPNTLEF